MVVEGTNAVVAVRQTVGATRPHEAAPGTIRADFAIEIGRNLVHVVHVLTVDGDEQRGARRVPEPPVA